MPTYIVVTILNQESHSLSFEALRLGYVQYALLAGRDIFQKVPIRELLASVGLCDGDRRWIMFGDLGEDGLSWEDAGYHSDLEERLEAADWRSWDGR